jgi:ribonucleotide reductase alpha subunit
VQVERPQHMWLRWRWIHGGTDFDRAIETYNLMSNKYFTHATPTCSTPDGTLNFVVLLPPRHGGQHRRNLQHAQRLRDFKMGGARASYTQRPRHGSHINGTNGYSNGIVPMLRVFNNTARYVDQCVVPETFIYTTDGPKHI